MSNVFIDGAIFDDKKSIIKKRHSVASCLKQSVPNRQPIKRRVSFSRKKTIQLISKEKQKEQWAPTPSPGFKAHFGGNKENLPLGGQLRLPTLVSSVLDDEMDEDEGLDDPELLNETMALDMTQDFSAHFTLPDINDGFAANNLSSLIENDDYDDTLSLPTNCIKTPINDTNSSAESASDITFLGGRVNDQTMEMDECTEDILNYMDKQNEEDMSISMNFNILTNLSQKIELGRTNPISIANLVKDDETAKEIAPSSMEEVDIDEDRTENFLFETTENLTTRSLFGMGTPVAQTSRTPRRDASVTRSARQPKPQAAPQGPISVDEFLSGVQIHFRIFDNFHKSSICIIPSNDVAPPTYSLPDDIYIPHLQSNLLIRPKIHLLDEKNTQYEKEITTIKNQIVKLNETLSKNNPECFQLNVLSRKELKSMRKKVQLFSKQFWYLDRIFSHKKLQKQLENIKSSLENSLNLLDNELQLKSEENITNTFPSVTLAFKEVDLSEVNELKDRVEDEAESYEIIKSLTSWNLMGSLDNSVLKFKFSDHILELALPVKGETSGNIVRCKSTTYAKVLRFLSLNVTHFTHFLLF